MPDHLPVFLADGHLVHIHSFYEPPLTLRQLDIVTTHLSLPHSSILRKCPILEAIAALPLHTILCVLVLIPELDRDFVCCECEELFAQTVVLLPLPFLCEQVYDLVVALDKAGSISPDAILGICFGNGNRIPRGTLARDLYKKARDLLHGVPQILRLLHLQVGDFFCEWRCERHGRLELNTPNARWKLDYYIQKTSACELSFSSD